MVKIALADDNFAPQVVTVLHPQAPSTTRDPWSPGGNLVVLIDGQRGIDLMPMSRFVICVGFRGQLLFVGQKFLPPLQFARASPKKS
jgi:hypothetical protein